MDGAIAAPHAWPSAVVVLLAAIPWLFPFTSGPSPAALPWLVSAACACLLACSGPWPSSRGFTAFAMASAAVAGWALLSHPANPVDALYLAAGLGVIVLVAAVARTPGIFGAIETGLLLAAMASAVIGLVQYFGLSQHFAPLVDIAASGEAFANLRQTNQYATLCWIGMAILVCRPAAMALPLACGGAILLASAAAASVSRTGLVEAIALLVLAVFWPAADRRRRLALCATAVAAYAIASLALPMLFEALTGALPERTLLNRIATEAGCHSRLVLWRNVLQLIAAHPWLGWGWGSLDEAHFLTLYPGPRFCEILDNAHNLPLHVAVELGVPAAMLLCVGGLAWCWTQRPWREQDPARQAAWSVLVLVGLHSLLEYPLWYGPFQIACGAALGCLLAGGPGAQPLRRGILGTALPLLLVAGVGYAAWDYWRVSQVYLPPSERREAWRADPLSNASHSWLFAAQARFAELTLTDIDRSNAAENAALAREMLHYSPEPRVVERLIEADTLLGNDREAVAMLARYRAAYPQDYEKWREAQRPQRANAGSGDQD